MFVIMKNHKYIRKKSQRQEARTAKDFGGRTQVASGAIPTLKGDVRSGVTTPSFNTSDFLVENKFTDADSYKLDTKTWLKIEGEALRDNLRIPLMQIDIQDVQVVVMNLGDFKSSPFNEVATVESIDTNFLSLPLKGDFYRGKFKDNLYYAHKIIFQKKGLHLVVMDYNDFKRILF